LKKKMRALCPDPGCRHPLAAAASIAGAENEKPASAAVNSRFQRQTDDPCLYVTAAQAYEKWKSAPHK